MRSKITLVFFIIILFSCVSDMKEQNIEKSTTKSIAFLGDSMTRGAVGTNVNISSVVQNNLPFDVYNFGNGGFNSSQVATIQGGKKLRLKLLNNTILPFNNGNTIITDYNILLFNSVSEQKFKGEINGIKGYLKRIPSLVDYNLTERLEFERSDSLTNFISTPNEVIFYFDEAEKHKDNIAVIWVGRNNDRSVTELNRIKDDINLMIKQIENPKRFLIISLCNGTLDDEKIGTYKYNNIKQLNSELKLIYNERFLDLRSYMINEAIYNSSISPTLSDLEDISSDCIPRSLLYDLVHFNDTGYLLAGNLISDKLASLYID